jgi:UDP-N-acetylglucosamine:LPS N-acetylglucosamine transferase
MVVTTHRIEHPALNYFNSEFGAHSDLSRYENILSNERVISPEVNYLNLLQMDSFVPARHALRLKSNLHDSPFITHMTRSLLYELKQQGKIGEACFTCLHEKIDGRDFLSVFKYFYILMLYEAIAQTHDAQASDPAFAFTSVAQYSDRLVKVPPHTLAKEERTLQEKTRKQFLVRCMLELASRPHLPRQVHEQMMETVRTLQNSSDFRLFHTQFTTLLNKLGQLPELEKICWRELQTNLSPYEGEEFFNQVFLRLKTENYYKRCLAHVTVLKESFEGTDADALLTLREKCKKAYNGCVYLLQDSKNMAACSPTRFAALTGKMRTEWQAINQVFNRAQGQHSHDLCACQNQTPPHEHRLATWPFNSHTLIGLKPAGPFNAQQIQERGLSEEEFRENHKRTVAILGCKWGGGHLEVCRGIANNLSSLGYHSITVDLPEVLISEDPIRSACITRWLKQDWSIASLFEGLIQIKAFAIISFLRWLKSKFFSRYGYSENELKLVLEHLLKINPDSVITTYSAHNESIIQACKILGIPCIHVATDVDTSVETRETSPDFKHFKMALPFNTPESIDPIANTTTPEQQFISGPPVRHAFTKPRSLEDIQRLKQKWGIDTRKKVVIISSGKNGNFSAYPELLARKYPKNDPDAVPIHLVVICGSQGQAFKRHLERNVISTTKLPITTALSYDEEKMEELISMASYGGVLVGKAGGGTIFEVFTRGLRTLVDNTRPGLFSQGISHFFVTLSEMILRVFGFRNQLPWEKVNMGFAKKHNLAHIFKEESEFLPKLEKMLDNNNRPLPLNIDIKNVEEEIPKALREMQIQADIDPEIRAARQIHRGL